MPRTTRLLNPCLRAWRQAPKVRQQRQLSTWNEPETDSWPSSPSPTPYDILRCGKKGNFSKAHFYELVKRYHPDMFPKHSAIALAPWHRLPEDIRKERFRLILLAKEILSCPHKKSAYDKLGIGWIQEGRPSGVYGGAEGYGTGGRYDSSWCATWEDWEEYRARRDGTSKPKPFMSHWKFTTVALIFSAAGSYLSFIFARAAGRRRSEFHEQISRELEEVLASAKSRPIRLGSADARAQVEQRLRGEVTLSERSLKAETGS